MLDSSLQILILRADGTQVVIELSQLPEFVFSIGDQVSFVSSGDTDSINYRVLKENLDLIIELEGGEYHVAADFFALESVTLYTRSAIGPDGTIIFSDSLTLEGLEGTDGVLVEFKDVGSNATETSTGTGNHSVAFTANPALLGLMGLGALGGGGGGGGGGGSGSSSPSESDPTAPTVDSIAVTATGAANNTLNEGDTVTVTVTMDEATVVGTTGGTPRIALTIGSDTKYATYVSGTGTTDLVFEYDVEASLTDADGISIAANTLSANSGSLKDAAGNDAVLTHSEVSTISTLLVDTTAPTIQSMESNGASRTVELTYDEALDESNVPTAASFNVLVAGVANPVTGVVVSGQTVTLTLTNTFSSGALVNVTYSDPTSANDVAAIQDLAGNDASGFTMGVLADGYIRGAQIYLDANANGVADEGEELVGVVSDEFGNFFIPSGANPNNYAIIATGGINIDTGIANTVPLKAPAGSTTINPITTLVQTLIDSGNAADAASASETIVSALGLTPGTDLTAFDPISEVTTGGDANALKAQKTAVQVVAIVSLPSVGVDAATAETNSNTILGNLATEINAAADSGEILDLSDAGSIGAVLDGVSVSAELESSIAEATVAFEEATDLSGIQSAQSEHLDKIAPDAATALSIASPTNDITPDLRVSFNTVDTDGTAVVVGDVIQVVRSNVVIVSHSITSEDLINGYADVTLPQLSNGDHQLTTYIVDSAGNRSSESVAETVSIDTIGPVANLSASTDGLVPGGESLLTITFSEAVAGFTTDDVSVQAGQVSSLSAPETLSSGVVQYTLTYTAPDQEQDSLEILVNGSGYSDLAGNSGADSNTLNLKVDSAPSIQISDDSPGVAAGDVLFNISFSEAVSDLDASDVTITGGTAGALTAVSPSLYTLAVTPDSNSTSPITVNINAGVVIDSAGNGNLQAATATQAVDTAAPNAPLANSVAGDNFVSASEKSAGVEISGTSEANARIQLGFAGEARTVNANDSGVWSYTLTRADFKLMGEGSETISITATDVAGNTSAETALSLSIDTIRPVLSSVVLSDNSDTGVLGDRKTNQDVASISFTAESGDAISYRLGPNGAFTDASLQGTGAEQTLTLTGLAEGANQVFVKVTDSSGNESTRSTTIRLDTVAPTIDDSSLSFGSTLNSVEDDSAVTLTVDLSGVENGLTAKLGLGGKTYTGIVEGGEASIQVSAAELQALNEGTVVYTLDVSDSAGNAANQLTGTFAYDATAPAVDSIAVTATGASNNTLNEGDTVTVTVTMDEATVVDTTGGTPRIALTIGSDTKYATYVSGTGTTDLVFEYDVEASLTDADGISIAANTLSANSGSLKDAAGNDAVLTHSEVSTISTLKVDTTAPAVDSIAVTATGASNNTLNEGDTVTVTVTMDEATVVDTTGGTPRIALTIGSDTKYATYVSGTGTTDLVFEYDVEASLTDADGISIAANTLSANSGSLKDAAGNDAVLTHSEVSTISTLKVDTTAPAVDSIAVTATGASNNTLNEGDTVTVTVTMDEATVVDTTGGTPRIALTIGSDTKYATYVSGTGTTDLVFEYDVEASLTDADGISIAANTLSANSGSLKDAAGNDAVLTHSEMSTISTLKVDTTAPTITIGSIDISADTGTSDSDFTTKTAAQTVSATLSAALAQGDVLYGSVDGGSNWTDITNKVSNGTTVSWDGVTLSGSSELKFKVTDAAGNDGTVATQAYVLDTTAPTITIGSIDISADTGTSDSDFTTKTAAQTVSATLSAALAQGDVLYGSVDGGSNWTDITNKVSNGTTVSWDGVTLSGSSELKFKVTDAAGNDGTVATQAYVLDTTAPTITIGSIDISADTGTSDSDFTTKTAAQTVSATLSAALAQGDVLYGSVDGGSNWTDITNKVSNGTTVSWDGVTLSGSSELKFKVTDAAGNDGTVATQAYVLDTTAPTITIGSIDISADTGTSDSDFTTKTAAQTVSATLSAALAQGDVLYGSVDGGSNWTDITNKVSNSTTVSWDGVTLSGSSELKFKVTDAAGNDGTVATQAYVLDTTAPTITIGSIDISADTGTSDSDFTTKTAAQTVSATLSAALAQGDVLYGSVDGGSNWTDITNKVSNGTTVSWDGVTLSGSSELKFKVTDAAGNDGTVATQSYVLDTTAPAVDSIAVTATGASNNTLNEGDTVTVTVTMDEATVVDTTGGTPRIALTIGSDTKYATYVSGTGTTDLVFEYDVEASLTDADGISIAANTLSANSGSLKDAAGNDAVLTHSEVSTISTLKVDTTAPAVDSIAVTATGASNNTLNEGDTVTVTVTMDEATVVDTTGGTPRIALTIGSDTKYATYVSGTGTTDLVFEYDVEASLTDADGISIAANTLSANSGSLKDAAGNDAVLTHSEVSTISTLKVDTTAPAVDSIAVTATGASNNTLNEGDTVTVTVTMDEATVVDTTGGTPRIALTIGSDTKYATYVSGTGTTDLVFEYDVEASLTDADGISIAANTLSANSGSLKDAAGNDAVLTHSEVSTISTLKVDTTAPAVDSIAVTATGASNNTLNEGDTVTVTVTMDEATVVDTTGGTPRIALTIGSDTKYATYVSGTGTTDLVFEYDVEASLTDADGISIAANTLSANSGSLKDAAGNDAVLAHSEVSAISTLLVDAIAPTSTIGSVSLSSDSGLNSSDFITNDSAQTVNAVLSAELEVGEVLYGSVDAGQTFVDITDKVSSTSISWDGVTLLEDAGSGGALHFKVVDAAGNSGTVEIQAYNVITQAPTIEITNISLSSDSGTSDNDFLTKTASQTISAELSAELGLGDLVYGSSDGGSNWTELTDAANGGVSNKISGTTITWDGVVLSGDSEIQFKVVDAVENEGPIATQAYVLDTTAPTITIGSIDISADTGTSDSDFTTKTAAQTVSATLSAALAQGDVLYGSVDGGSNWTDITNKVSNSTTVSWDGVTLSGSSELKFKVTDAAGNDGTVATQAYVLDTTAPTITIGSIDISADTGTSDSDFTTKTAAQTVSATLSAALAQGDVLYGSVDGGSNWTDITNKVSNGTTVSWDGVTLSGSSELKFKVTDAAGNDGTVATQSYVLDTTAPAVDSIAVTATGASNNTLNEGDTVTVTVTMDEATVVDTTGGTPRIALTIGSDTKYATYVSGTGTTDLVFEYDVEASLTDADGISIAANTLSANSGSLKDAAGNDAVLTHSEVSTISTLKVDTTAPAVDSIAVTATGASNNTLNEGDTVTVTVTMDEATVVDTTGGTPRIALTIGSDTKYATYVSGTGTTDLVFEYDVEASLTDADGISIAANTLSANSGSLKDAAGNDAVLTHSEVSTISTLKVDTTAPAVDSIAVTATGASNNTLNEGDTVTVTVTMDEATVVDTTGGTPRIALTIGSDTKYATYVSGTGTTDLVFEYDVEASLTDADGISIAANTLSANSGSLKDAAGNDAVLTHSEVSTISTLKVDTTAPAVDSIAVTATGASNNTLNEGDTVTVTVTMDEATVVDTTGGTPRIALTIGSDTKYATYVSGTGTTDLVFEYDVEASLTDADGISIAANTLSANSGSLKDAAGNDAVLTHSEMSTISTLKVDTTAPTITIGSIDISADTGTSDSDFTTKTAAQTVSATLSAALAQGDVLYGSVDGGSNWTDITNKVSNGTTVSWDGVTLSGSSELKFKVTDAAGNDGTVATQAYVLDTTAPTITIGSIDISADTGTSDSDFTTKTAAQTVSATLSAALAQGDVLYGSVDGGSNWTDITNKVSNGTTVSWDGVTLSGSSELKFKVTDAAGNDGTVATQAYVLDTTAPTITIGSIDISADTGTSDSDFTTKTAAQTVSATLSAALAQGDVLYGSVDGGSNWTDITNKVSNGTTVSWDGVTLSGSSELKFKVTDAAGNDGTVATQSYVLDTTAPAVDSIAVTATGASNNTLNEGDTVTVTVTMDEATVVDTTGGTPRIALTIGSDTKYATYVSGTGTTDLVFEYDVEASLTDADGISIAANTLSANSGSLKDAAGNDAVLTHSEVSTISTLKVDTTAPAVDSIAVTATGASNNTLNEGDTVTVTVTMDEATVVDTTGGTPRIALTIGSDTKYATYVSGTGTTDLVFEYDVEASLTDADGISIAANTLSANSGSLKDAAGNDAVLTHSEVSTISTLKVDTTAPAVDSIAVTATGASNNTLNEGDTVTVTVTMDEATVVDTTGGTPRIALTIGSDTKYATYVSGTGTTDLVFEYDVEASLTDADGISIAANTLSANSGSLKDAAGNDAVLTHSEVSTISTLKVDTTAPAVDSIAVTATGASNNTLNEGDTVTVTVTMDEATVVDTTGGTPRIALTIGSDTKYATYVSGTGTTDLVFEYDVEASLTDADGISIAANTLSANSGSLKDAAGNDAVLTHSEVSTISTLKVDTTAPAVDSIAVTATGASNNTLNEGDTVTVTVTMDEATVVDTTGGTPRIALTIGSDTKYATYVSGTGTTDLVFEYDVEASLTDADGISIAANTLSANSGSLKDAAGNDAVLTHSEVSTISTLKVDTTAPAVDSIAVTATGASNNTLNEGDTVTVTVTMDEATVVDTTGGTPRIALTIGSDTKYATYVSGTGTTDLVFEYDVEASLTDADGISIAANTLSANSGSLKDAAGNDAVLTHSEVSTISTLKVDTTAPAVDSIAVTATGAANNTLNEGDTVTVTVTMDEATVVDTTGGTPRIALTIGSDTKYATYVSGTGTTDLVFEYDVEASLTDADGISIAANTLSANSGSLKDAAGNDAVLTHSEMSTISTLKVDTDAPAPASTTPLLTGESLPVISGSFPEGSIQSVAINGVTYPISSEQLTTSGSTWSLTIPNDSSLSDGTYDVTVVTIDEAGNTTTATSSGAVVVNSSLDTGTNGADIFVASASDQAIYLASGNDQIYLSGNRYVDSDYFVIVESSSNGSTKNYEIKAVDGIVPVSYGTTANLDSFSFDLNFDAEIASYVDGSMSGVSGFTFTGNDQSSNNGVLVFGGFNLNGYPISGDTTIASFSLVHDDTDSPVVVDLVEPLVDDQVGGDIDGLLPGLGDGGANTLWFDSDPAENGHDQVYGFSVGEGASENDTINIQVIKSMLRGDGDEAQKLASGSNLGSDTGFAILTSVLDDLDESTLESEAFAFVGENDGDVLYMIASDGTNSALMEVTYSDVAASVEYLATFNGLGDLTEFDQTNVSGFTVV